MQQEIRNLKSEVKWEGQTKEQSNIEFEMTNLVR